MRRKGNAAFAGRRSEWGEASRQLRLSLDFSTPALHNGLPWCWCGRVLRHRPCIEEHYPEFRCASGHSFRLAVPV